LLEQLDAFRKPQRFEKFLLASEADARGRPGYENRSFPQSGFFRKAFAAAQSVDIKSLVAQGYSNRELAEKIRQERTRLVAAVSK